MEEPGVRGTVPPVHPKTPPDELLAPGIHTPQVPHWDCGGDPIRCVPGSEAPDSCSETDLPPSLWCLRGGLEAEEFCLNAPSPVACNDFLSID